MTEKIQDFTVDLGETFHPVIRWMSDKVSSAAVTGITQAAPAVVTAPTHGVPDGWPVALVSVQGMTQINSPRYPPRVSDMTPASYLTGNSVALNHVNSADFSPYTSGGFLVYSTPININGATARFTVWDNPNETGTPLLQLTETSGITLNTVNFTITPQFETAGLNWTLGYYDLRVTDNNGITTLVLEGTINIDA